MSLVLVRHGETALNAARVLQPADTPLSARGLAQAAAAAGRLATLQPAALISSDLPRALQTAQVIAARTGLAVETTPLLRERDFGDWRGRRYEELGFDPVRAVEGPPDGEALDAFLERADAAWQYLVRWRPPCTTVLVVTHGLLLRALVERHAQAGPPPLPERIGNTAITVLDGEPPTRLRLAACVAHLDAAVADARQAGAV